MKKRRKRSKMIRRLAVIFVFLCLIMGSSAVQGEEVERPEERITKPQPLYIGTEIFYKGHPKIGHQVYYTYLGFKEGMLHLKYEKYYHFDELVETEFLTLPLGPDRDAKFITEPIEGEQVKDATRLKLTVIDSYGRIRVEKIQ
jgi:hypothetical protein